MCRNVDGMMWDKFGVALWTPEELVSCASMRGCISTPYGTRVPPLPTVGRSKLGRCAPAYRDTILRQLGTGRELYHPRSTFLHESGESDRRSDPRFTVISNFIYLIGG